MKFISTSPKTAAFMAAIPGLTLFMAASSAFAQTAKSGSGMHVISVESATDDQASDKHTYEIRIENGKVTVKRDGKDVPDSEIRNEDGRISIVDAQGNPFDVGFNVDADGALRSFLGHGGGDMKWLSNVNNQEAPKVMLGLQMGEPGPALEHHLKLEPGKTVMIVGLYEGLPAEQAGLSEYDIITKVNGESPGDAGAIKEILSKKEAGDTITLDVIHEGKSKQVKVKLEKYDAKTMEKAKLIGQGPQDQWWTWSKNGEFEPQGTDGMYKRFFVAPGKDGKHQLEMIAPSLEPLIRQHLKESSNGRADGVDDQLQRLDKRMDDLEQLLQKLIDRQERNR